MMMMITMMITVNNSDDDVAAARCSIALSCLLHIINYVISGIWNTMLDGSDDSMMIEMYHILLNSTFVSVSSF